MTWKHLDLKMDSNSRHSSVVMPGVPWLLQSHCLLPFLHISFEANPPVVLINIESRGEWPWHSKLHIRGVQRRSAVDEVCFKGALEEREVACRALREKELQAGAVRGKKRSR
ncbi:uncharacterized protein LOC144752812 [Lissotriton helveticus]